MSTGFLSEINLVQRFVVYDPLPLSTGNAIQERFVLIDLKVYISVGASNSYPLESS